MSPAERTALARIEELAGRGRFEVIGDANVWGLGGLGLQLADVRSALVTATGCELQGDHVLVTGGVDLDGVVRICRVRLIADCVCVEGVR